MVNNDDQTHLLMNFQTRTSESIELTQQRIWINICGRTGVVPCRTRRTSVVPCRPMSPHCRTLIALVAIVSPKTRFGDTMILWIDRKAYQKWLRRCWVKLPPPIVSENHVSCNIGPLSSQLSPRRTSCRTKNHHFASSINPKWRPNSKIRDIGALTFYMK